MEPVTPLTLQGQHVRLEPLMPGHLDGLQAVVEGPRNTFGLTPVPRNRAELEAYVDAALEDQRRTTALPFATIDPRSGRVVGTTRFGNLEFWPIPPGSTVPPRPAGVPYAVEIGWTWLAPDAQRTAINTEAKRLMLAHAFERWEVYRVTLKTDARNVRSRAAIERIGCRLDGVLRAHSPAADGGPRDAALYSMLAREWPDARARLDARLARGAGPAT
ncbi:MAG: N-acetyltransferase [Myxococcaceae bacterium]|nr:MAG: N-acetyltransferase [Myxococcaceae bacterium]